MDVPPTPVQQGSVITRKADDLHWTFLCPGGHPRFSSYNALGRRRALIGHPKASLLHFRLKILPRRADFRRQLGSFDQNCRRVGAALTKEALSDSVLTLDVCQCGGHPAMKHQGEEKRGRDPENHDDDRCAIHWSFTLQENLDTAVFGRKRIGGIAGHTVGTRGHILDAGRQNAGGMQDTPCGVGPICSQFPVGVNG